MIRPTALPARPAGWREALRRGLQAFLAMAALGLAASFVLAALTDPGYPLGVVLKIGALYLGPFHHVPIVATGRFDVEELIGGDLPGSEPPTTGSTSVEIGIALLLATMLAVWTLFRGGQALAAGARGGAVAHALAGARIAPAYAVPVFLVAATVKIEESVTFGAFVSGEIHVQLSARQALAFPLALAAVSGAAGGLWAWASDGAGTADGIRTGAALVGGWRMFVLGLALSYAGLFAAGIVQPDGSAALLTPSTARYFRTVFERPGRGAAIAAHHLALAPNEALWALVPASGGCDVVRGSTDSDLLCYRRFPRAGPLDALADPDAQDAGLAPVVYFLFLLAPALATVLGGRAAAARGDTRGWAAVLLGAAAGITYALLVGAGCLLASVTLVYGATFGPDAGGGSLWIGPDPVSGTLLALAWGVLGGALGAATAGQLRRRRVGRGAGRSAAR